jgi:TM2 domain-containing membrane protein YozV/cold shock CspA family protein
MRGRVLSYDATTGAGLISGDDGHRYTFTRAALQGGYTAVVPGTVVDFQTEDGVANGVYVLPSFGDKNRIVAAVLAFFLGHWGIHKFYLGKTNAGIIMLVMGTVGWILIIPGLVNWAIAFIECIIYLTKSDQQFYQDYVIGDRTWL